jgi:hypothetical protein
MPTRQRRVADNKSARWGLNKIVRRASQSETGGRVFSVKRQREYQNYRTGTPDRTAPASSMPVLIGAAMIAAAILLSTLITALGGRYFAFEGPTEESAWLVDRLSGNLYRCQAPERGKASCEAEGATGTITERPKR